MDLFYWLSILEVFCAFLGLSIVCLLMSRVFDVLKKPKPRKLIILDLNGVCVDREYLDKASNVVPGVQLGKFMVYKRPHIDEFIDFLFEHFDVAVWSSANKNNVDNMVTHVFANRKSRLLFVWHQTQCMYIGQVDLGNGRSKPLYSKLVTDVTTKYEAYRGNVLLLDDTSAKLDDNNPFSYLCLPTWKCIHRDDKLLALDGNLVRGLAAMAASELPMYEYLSLNHIRY
jgi:hypothetical protein